MSKYSLTAEPRNIVGKKVKSIRAGGGIPATIYGKETKPNTITVETKTFLSLYKEAGETGLIDLTVDGKNHPVLIHNVQTHPLTKEILNIEFHEVNLKEKVHAEIPVECVGEPVAIKEKLGILLTLISHVEVEALPTNLPEKLTVDISHLANVDEQVTVADLSVPKEVTMVTDATIIIAKIGAFIVEKEPEPVVEAPIEEAGTETSPTEAAPPEQASQTENTK